VEIHTPSSRGFARQDDKGPSGFWQRRCLAKKYVSELMNRGTKAEIIARIDGKVGLSKNHVSDVLEATFEIIKSCLEIGGNVKISGFGSFVVRSKIPAGEEIQRPARRLSSRAAGYLPSRQARR